MRCPQYTCTEVPISGGSGRWRIVACGGRARDQIGPGFREAVEHGIKGLSPEIRKIFAGKDVGRRRRRWRPSLPGSGRGGRCYSRRQVREVDHETVVAIGDECRPPCPRGVGARSVQPALHGQHGDQPSYCISTGLLRSPRDAERHERTTLHVEHERRRRSACGPTQFVMEAASSGSSSDTRGIRPSMFCRQRSALAMSSGVTLLPLRRCPSIAVSAAQSQSEDTRARPVSERHGDICCAATSGQHPVRLAVDEVRKALEVLVRGRAGHPQQVVGVRMHLGKDARQVDRPVAASLVQSLPLKCTSSVSGPIHRVNVTQALRLSRRSRGWRRAHPVRGSDPGSGTSDHLVAPAALAAQTLQRQRRTRCHRSNTPGCSATGRRHRAVAGRGDPRSSSRTVVRIQLDAFRHSTVPDQNVSGACVPARLPLIQPIATASGCSAST